MESYTTIQGDTWDMIAKKVFGDEKKMDLIMKCNFPLLDYVVFPAGVSIAIPDITAEEETGLPVWRK